MLENVTHNSIPILQATYAAIILTVVAVKAKNKMQGK